MKNTTAKIIVCFAVSAALLASRALGDNPFTLTTRSSELEQVFAKERQPRPDLREIHSPALDRALKEPEKLLQFITAPETAYADRMAAMYQGAWLVPLDQMPTVLRERDEVDREGIACGWGLLPHPLDQAPRFYPDTQPSLVVVLGYRWEMPATRSAFPLTWEEEYRGPWPWQVQQALGDLFQGMAPNVSVRGNLPKRCQQWLDVAMTMPCEEDAQAIQFVEATKQITCFSSPAIMSRWRRIAGDPKMAGAASLLSSGIGDYVTAWTDDRAQGLVQLIIVSLLNQPGPKGRLLVSCHLDSMREQWLGGQQNKRLPVPATSVLEFCKLAVDPKAGDDWTRLFCYAMSVCRTVDDPPFNIELNHRIDPESPEVQQRLNEFSAWFDKSRPDLERQAQAEAPYLDKLQKESDAAAARRD